METTKLSTGAFGDSVKRLHDDLRRAGFEIPEHERTRRFFGPGTREALRRWQKKKGVRPTGEVDAETVNRLSAGEVDHAKELSASPALIAGKKPLETETSGEAEDEPQVIASLEPADRKISLEFSTRDKRRLKNLKLSLGYKKPKKKLDTLFKQAEGGFDRLNTLLKESQDFDDVTTRKLIFANELAELTEDNEKLVGDFLANNKSNSLRDIALNFKKDQLKALIKNKVPAGYEDEAVSKLQDRLFRMAPAAVIHRMTRDKELEAEEPVRSGLLEFFKANPELDFRKDSILNVLNKPEALKNVPEDYRDKVVNSLKSFQRLSAICPNAEVLPELMKVELDSAYAINEVPLDRFVALYSSSLGGEEVARSIHARAQNISVRNEHALIALRDTILSPSVNMVHGGQSVDARRAIAVQISQQKSIPINFETLFGSVDLCECKHCNSVYSPAAYLVELFQYLRNNNLDLDSPKTGQAGITGTPLKQFFRRRPDLGRLQLTCENTHTLIPYIDLVNEVMESFVVNLKDYEQDNHEPKQANIAVHNVKNESSGELLAEPQHTHYQAYKTLKNAVYPVCKLPYHQPIDTTRQYLNFLETSRYELFTTFRRDVSVLYQPDENADDAEIERLTQLAELEKLSVDRASAAEYLQLVEEEYVILTKQGFRTKEWYELDEQTDLTLAQYQDKIGLKETWDYYGIGSQNQMLAELKWVKPAPETGIVGFLRRVNIQYVDLIELLKTRYINPNYPSGKALAFMNSLPYSYRYLQTLVDDSQTDMQTKYQQLIGFLQANLKSFAGNRFDMKYVACWVYSYFEKIGQLIVLEDGSSCKCIEGSFRLPVIHMGDDAGSLIGLAINSNCQIYIENSDPKNVVGHLDPDSGKLAFDEDFIDGFAAVSEEKIAFSGKNGEHGTIESFILSIKDGTPLFFCSDLKETCDLSKTQLKHLDGTDLVTSEYDRMHRFIRLWCKLDWSIEEVDQAITGVGETIYNPPTGLQNFTVSNTFVAFQPTFSVDDGSDLEIQNTMRDSNIAESARNSRSKRLSRILSEDEPESFDDALIANLPGGDPKPNLDDLTIKPLVVDPAECKPEVGDLVVYEITPYLIDQLVAVKELQRMTNLNLDKLLTLWTSIGITGEKSLYEQLFIKYNLIAEDKIFQEDEFGTYLTQGATISDHLPALMAALKVDVAMLEKIMVYAGIADELTLPNVSHIYRHVLLAKSLGLRVKQLPELFELIKDQAHPFGQPINTLSFYRLFERIDDSAFDIRKLNYIIRNEDDPDRPLRPETGDVFRLAVDLRNALLKIEADHPDIIDDAEATEELLREKLSLLFDDTVGGQIINLVQGTTVYEDNTRRKYSANLEEQSDRDAIVSFLFAERKTEAEAPGGEFQTFLQRVQYSGERGLQVTGILNESDQTRLLALADLIGNDDDREKFLIAANKILAQPKRFFDDALAPIFPEQTEAAETILLAEDTVDSEGGEVSAILKRDFLIRGYLPYLREQLRQRQVIQILTSNLGLDQDVTTKLVMEVIKTDEGEALYQEIIRLKEQKDPVEDDQEAPHIWEGFFVPEKEGKYTFLLEAEGDATLTFGNQTLWSGPERTDEEQINFYQSPTIFLKAGHTYPFRLQRYDEDDEGKIIGLFLKFDDQPQIEISEKLLFPALRTKIFNKAYSRLHKAAMLSSGFGMDLAELEFFLEFPANFEGLDFNTLTFPQWLRLEAFYRLHKSLSAKELSLIEFLRWTYSTDDAESDPSLATQISLLTGWEETDVDKLVQPKHFNLSHPQHFRDEKNLMKLQDTLHLAQKIGVGIDLLFQWGTPTSLFNSTRKIAGAIREAIRARYDQEEWEEVIKPVHDRLRENQKQALIAYLLAQQVLLEWGLRDADSLFEFFLIDVQMDACMETSRIKQAISSVQLFVQRCFLGLEEKHGVGSEILDRQRWEWMSRYRVWEANRKVFLYPENWIRPELRDDKSPFFKELESELLQNDVSQDTVKSALTKYIVQVDEVANLEVVGQYTERDIVWRKLHIIGRTRNAPYFYYYRNYEFDNKYWYPWEKIEVDIPSVDIEDENGRVINNGTFVVPVVWLNRLFIFFPQFMQKSWKSSVYQKMKIADSAEGPPTNCAPLPFWEIKMAWSEYKEGKWTPKQISNGAIYTLNKSVDKDFHQLVAILLDREKFIFAPFVKTSKIVIQPYYFGTSRSVEDKLKNGNEFSRFDISGDAAKSLSKSFEFNGNQIKKVNYRVSDVVPVTWKGKNVFHRTVESISDSTLYPIQANGSEKNPGDYFAPKFLEKNDDNIFITLDTYPIQHKETKKLLGYLRIDRLNEIFNNGIPPNNDNYGSNDGIQYHELKRPYAIYNWEALFHSVSLLADNLSKSQRFEESMTWWHYIFDPINVKGDIKKVWKFWPFRAIDSKNVLEKIFNRLDPNTPDDEITEWRDNPFMPHVIARSRPSAYMKWVVMKYIDNLIAWGDSLFRQDTIESINQATQLYILAGHILGPRPEIIPKRGKVQPKSYMDLVDEWDAFSNAMVDLELIFPFSNQIAAPTIPDGEPHYINIYGFATTLYFCIPDNPKLLEYWDTVSDRLFKIRHCLNIEGVFRKLNLFEPPIDPALLVQAAAQGLSIGSVLNDLSTPIPNYRFNYLLARALEVTSEVKSLGNALLSALEKKDTESLSLLRARHDTNIQTLVMDVRNLQLEEAEKTKASLEENRKTPVHRLEYYQQLAGEEVSVPAEDAEFTLIANNLPEVKEESGMKLIGEEAEEIKKAKLSRDLQIGVGSVETLAGIFNLVPNFTVDGKPIGIGAGMEFGGQYLGTAMQAVARGLQIGVNVTSAQSAAAARKAGYKRQLMDRIFQANLAGQEIQQIDKQITAQKIRIDLAQKEIDNHQVQIDQTKEVEEFVRSKFSNDQLYHWMSDQLKDLYYQTYSFAYDLAKKAEKVYRFEMGLSTSDFVKFGYWNSAKEGFLAGEQLYLALKQLENAYIETKPHDYEITKHISLRQVNPLALIQLKEQGACEFNLVEALFDLDYPGQYKRRIKTVAVSIPCIVGPHTSLNCTLRQLKHEYRNSKLATNSNYPKKLEEADERFVTNPIPTTAIAVSQGQNDSGVFELTFQSERYLPFEGSGAISSWRLELPQEFLQFDYQTITDVVIHLRYTSCEGGNSLKTAALENLNAYVSNAAELSKTEGLFRMFSLPHEFPNEWHHLFNPEPDSENQILHFGNLKERFPFFAQSQQIESVNIVDFRLFAPGEGLQMNILKSDQAETLADDPLFSSELSEGAQTGNLHQYVIADLSEELTGYWGIQFNQDEPLTKDQLKDAWLVVKYAI